MNDPAVRLKVKVQFGRAAKGRRTLAEVPPAGDPPAGREAATAVAPATPPNGAGTVPRVARLVALALKLDGMVRRGEVRDYAELARLGRVTRARLTQLMNLTLLAPEIIEQILHLPPVTHGRDPVGERDLRPIAAEADWRVQRRRWRELNSRPDSRHRT